jgi:hypothetical protein
MPAPSTAPLRRVMPPLVAMAAIGLIAGYLVVQQALVAQARPATPTPSATTSVAGDLLRAGAPAAAAKTDPETFKFLLLQPNTTEPVRWNPCIAVTYRVATNGEVPASEVDEVRAAFATVGQALGGVDFEYQGATDVVPDTIDDSWRAGTDIVFAFAEAGPGPRESTLLNGWEAGRGGLAADGERLTDGGVVHRPTHGSVVIDADKWRVMDRHDRGILYLHEIGHAVGLDHPADAHQIMSSGAYDLSLRYQPGDLAGLARLGRQAGCTG